MIGIPFAEKVPPMEASKWLKVQLLVNDEEMRGLLEALSPFFIYIIGGITPEGGAQVPHEQFLEIYKQYSDALKEGLLPEESLYRPLFSTVFTTAPQDCLRAIKIDGGRQLVRVVKPVIQLQPHSLDYSPHDGKFRPMVFGLDSVLWGIQFSYPQLFLDPATKQPHQVDDSETFPDTRLFRALQKWVRQNSIPTPFLVGEERHNMPMRLGKNCLGWINRHPQVVQKGWRVKDDR